MRSVGVLLVGVVLLAMLAASWWLGGSPSEMPASTGAAGDSTASQHAVGSGADVDDSSSALASGGRRELERSNGGSIDEPTQTVRVQVIHAETRAPVPHAELVTWPPNDDPLDMRDDESFGEALRRLHEPVRADARGIAEIEVTPAYAEVFAFADGLYGAQEFEPPLRDTLLVVVARDIALEGRVVDGVGRPVAGVDVDVFADLGTERMSDPFADSANAFSDEDGRFRLPHLQAELRNLQWDELGRPRLRWEVDYAGMRRSGGVDWMRPLVIELAAAGYLDLDLCLRGEASWRPAVSAHWIGDAGRRLSFGHDEASGADLSALVPLGREIEVVVARSSSDEVRSTLSGPKAPGERVLHPVNLPWEFALVRARLVDEAGEPIDRADVELDPDAPLADGRQHSDGLGRIEEAWWLPEDGSPGLLRRIVVTPQDHRSVELELRRVLLPGVNDLGDLRVERREVPLVATVRVEGLDPEEVVVSCEAKAIRSALLPRSERELICRRVGPRVFEARGEGVFTYGVSFQVSGALFRGFGRVVPPATELVLQVKRLGALDIEVLAPGELVEDRLYARVRFEDDAIRELWLETVAPGTVRGTVECEPGTVTLEVLDGERILATVEDLQIEPRRRLALVGARAIDLRAAYRDVLVEFVDAAGAPVSCGGEWWEWRDDATESPGVWFEGARLPLHLPKDVKRLVFVADEQFGPAWVEIVGPTARVPLRAWQEVDLSVDVGELPDGIEAPMEVEIVDDRQPVGWDDPRREDLGLDRWERVTVCDEPEYTDDYLPGMVLELRVALARVGGRRIDVLRERVEIRPGLEVKRLTPDAARLRAALESLRR